MSLLETYQSCKNLLASKLESKGVNASGNEGLTSLINKISNIAESKIPTKITRNGSSIFINTHYTVGDSYSISGHFQAETVDGITIESLSGVTILLVCDLVGSLGTDPSIMGQGTVNSDGSFTINGKFKKAYSTQVRFFAVFEGTNHFASSNLVYAGAYQINKKTVTLPSDIQDAGLSDATTLEFDIGSEYQDAPITLFINDEAHSTVFVDSDGNVEFDISDVEDDCIAQLKILANDGFETSQSNIFNIYKYPAITLGITGSSFSSGASHSFEYTGNVLIDWGDGSTLETYTGQTLSHTYASSGSHTINFYGNITQINSSAFINANNLTSVSFADAVTTLEEFCLMSCTGLTNINVASSVTSIGRYSFMQCTALTEIVLNWDTSSDILLYDNTWINQDSSFDHFLIPQDTTSLYIAKGYPSNLLQEDTTYDEMSLSLTAGSQILSYADEQTTPDGQYATFTAQLTLEDEPVAMRGVPIVFLETKGQVLYDTTTVNTDNNGQATYTYASKGRGDIDIVVVPDNRELLTKTYKVEDCLSTDWGGFITSSYANASVSDGQLSFSNSSAYYGAYIFNQKPTSPYMVELTYVHTSGGNFVFGLGFVNDNYNGTNGNYIANVYYGRTNWDYWGCLATGKATAPVTGDVYRFEVYEDHIDTYKNDALLKTCTPSDSSFTGRFAIIGTDSPRLQHWKNIKIKQL